MNQLTVWSLVGELGLIISIPLVIFLLIGLKIDLILHTKPLCTFIGIGFAVVGSYLMIHRKIKQLNAMEVAK